MITLQYGTNAITIPMPNSGYRTSIEMAFDLLELSNGSNVARDESRTYDQRVCDLDFILNDVEQAALSGFLNSTARGNPITISIPSNAEFYPFAPDYNAKQYSVVMVENGTPKVTYSPLRYFKGKVQATLVAPPVTYSIPSSGDSDGPVAFDTNAASIRYPIDLFSPVERQSYDVQFSENNTVKLVDKTTGYENKNSAFKVTTTKNNAARIVDRITAGVRTGQYKLDKYDYSYPFGPGYAASYVYFKLASNKLEVVHSSYNEFELTLNVKKV